MTSDRRFAAPALSVSVLSAVTLLVLCLLPASADAQTTALFLDSQPGDALGGGVQRTDLPATGATFQTFVLSDNAV
jgi:hypothetical protein